MKNNYSLLAVLFYILPFSSVHAEDLKSAAPPICKEDHQVFPCIESPDQAGFEFVDMMIENIKGVKMVHSGGKAGLHVENKLGIVTLVSSQALSQDRHSPFVDVTKFEIELSDHGGGDIDYPHKKWTVIKTTLEYGYVSKTTYENFLDPIK